jgi:hypothetical protein
LGRSWRDHDDLDIGIRRADLPAAMGWLAGWDFRVAPNNVWARRGYGPWEIDLTVGEGDEDHWTYRRDPTLTRTWEEAVLWTADGVPYLAPELQLLFKGKKPRPKDDQDLEAVVPELSVVGLEFLAASLPIDHTWQEMLKPSG